MRHGDAKHRRARTEETRRQPTLERAGSARVRFARKRRTKPGQKRSFCPARRSGLETSGLHALAGEKAVDRFAMNAQHPADAHSVETPVVNQTPDRLRMDAELVGDLTNADELRLLLRR